MFKDITKFFSKNQPWVFLAIILILAVAIGQYSSNKGVIGEYMSGAGLRLTSTEDAKNGTDLYNMKSSNNVQPSAPLGSNGGFAKVSGMDGGSNQGMPPSCNKQVEDPSALLPKDQNSEWSQLNPTGDTNTLNGINLLQAGHHICIDTVGQALRNSNLQIRSEPANPQVNIGPWNNTTIEPDVMRTPLELGQGAP